MAVLGNHRRELFAQGVARGWAYARAYAEAGYVGKDAADGGKHLMLNAEVRARVAELKEQAAVETVFGMQEAMRFLIEVIETPVGAVDQHSRICQEWTRDELSTRTASSLARKTMTSAVTYDGDGDGDGDTTLTGRKRAKGKSRAAAAKVAGPELGLEGLETAGAPVEVTPMLSRIKVKMPDKLKALELLARFSSHGWFGTEKRKVEISDLEAVVAAVSR